MAFLSIEMASVEIVSTPTKVVVIKPQPFEPDERKIGRAILDSDNERVKSENSTNLNSENISLNNTVNGNDSSEHPEIKNWPTVFVLQPDPTNPVICYAGKSININKNDLNDLEISSIKDATTNGTDSSARNTKKFVLSRDPLYPVICQEVNIPPHSINNGTTEDGNATISNVTCIRRDYEKNISAIFIHEVGPIQSAWNIFNNTMAYGYFNVENVNSIGEIRVLTDTIVDCEEYGFIIGDKGLSPGAVAALLG